MLMEEEEEGEEAADAAQGHKCLARRLGNNKGERGEWPRH